MLIFNSLLWQHWNTHVCTGQVVNGYIINEKSSVIDLNMRELLILSELKT